MPEQASIAERWQTLDSARSNKLTRARRHAELVMPTLLPQNTSVFDEELPVPHNSLPSEAVNSLSAKSVSVLLPLNDLPFYEILIPDLDPVDESSEEVSARLRQLERKTMDRLYATNLRSVLHTAKNHLLVVGDVLLMQQPDFDFRLFRLDQYVVLRYNDGRWYEIITREQIDPDNPPPNLPNIPSGDGSTAANATPSGGVQFDPARTDQSWMFTRITRNSEGNYEFEREWKGQKFDGRTLRISPYFPLRWRAMTGEHYGRSEVEDAFGDIVALDSVTKSLIDGAALSSEYRWQLDPFAMLSIDDFMDSINGDVLAARDGEITPIQFQNHSQMAAAQNALNYFHQSLGRRFLMNQAIQPTGERVTAQQVSILAQEIDAALGGMLSIAAREIQIPIVRNTMSLMADAGEIPPELREFLGEDSGIINIRIRAGLEVLKREAESERLNSIMERVMQLPPPAQNVLHWPRTLRKWIISTGIDANSLVKTDEEISAEQEAAMMAQQSQALGQQAQTALRG